MIEDTYLPQCLAIGIRTEEFWHLNIRTLRPFLKAEEIKFQQRNREMHLQGAYIHEAVAVAIGNAFRKSGSKSYEYPSKPYEFSDKPSERKHNSEVERLKAAFQAFVETTKTRLEHGS